MNAWIVRLLAPWIVFILPWSAAAYQRRWSAAICLGAIWAAALACASWLWFGPGAAMLVATGVWALLTTPSSP
jgi:hypothetical protein